MKQGIIIALLAIAATLGACKDVPIDDGTSHVITTPLDSTHQHQDTCVDCAPAHRPPAARVRTLTLYYTYKEPPNSNERRDSVEIDLSSPGVMHWLTVTPEQSGGENLSFEFETPIQWPDNAPWWLDSLRKLRVTVHRVGINAQGRGDIDLQDNLYENPQGNGAAMYYPSGDTTRPVPWYTTDHRGHSDLKIMSIDTERRLIEGIMNLEIYFPYPGITVPGRPDRLFKLEIGASLRLGY